MENVQDVFKDIMKYAELSDDEEELEESNAVAETAVETGGSKVDINDFFKGLVVDESDDEEVV